MIPSTSDHPLLRHGRHRSLITFSNIGSSPSSPTLSSYSLPPLPSLPLTEIHDNFKSQRTLVSSASSTSLGSRRQLRTKASHKTWQEHHGADIVLATEIGQGLVNEVRKMQGLLQIKQDSLSALEIQQSEAQQRVETLVRKLKQKCELEEKLKEEIWNLELSKQELLQQVQQLTQKLSRCQMEQARMARQESLVTQELELLKAAHESWSETLTRLQQDHDKQLASLHKTLDTTRREKDELAKKLQTLTLGRTTTELALLAKRGVNQVDCENADDADDDEDDQDGKLVESLQLSLAQAHSVVQSLQQDLDKERQKRSEVDKLLRESQQTIENLHRHPELLWAPPTMAPSPTLAQSPSSSFYARKTGDSDTLRADPDRPGSPKLPRCRSLGEELRQAMTMAAATVTDNGKNVVQGTKNMSERSKKCDSMDRKKSVVVTEAEKKALTAQQLGTEEMTIEQVSKVRTPTVEPITHRPRTWTCAPPSNDPMTPPLDYGCTLFEPGPYACSSNRIYRGSSMHSSQGRRFDRISAPPSMPSKDTDNLASNDEAISSVTRTMIGEWMWKYTRNVVGTRISEKKHRRFFWIHPYTKTLYWSAQDPNVNGGEWNAKSVSIESFVVLSFGRHASSRHQPPSVIIKTSTRDVKIQCLDHQSYRIWTQSLRYLLYEEVEKLPCHSLPNHSPWSERRFPRFSPTNEGINPSIPRILRQSVTPSVRNLSLHCKSDTSQTADDRSLDHQSALFQQTLSLDETSDVPSSSAPPISPGKRLRHRLSRRFFELGFTKTAEKLYPQTHIFDSKLEC